MNSRSAAKLLLNYGFKALISSDPSTNWLEHTDKKITALLHIKHGECLICKSGWKKNYHSLSALEEALENDFIEDRRKDKINQVLENG
jgi:hypothetical protein